MAQIKINTKIDTGLVNNHEAENTYKNMPFKP